MKLRIIGMHCTSCAMNIDGDLEDLVDGVKASSTHYAKGITEVEFDEQKVKDEQIIKQIKETGYTAHVAQD